MTPQLQSQADASAVSSWPPLCHITYTRDTWVTLAQRPSGYAAAEAKLLCQATPDTWVAWVPDHGETLLHKSHFYV